MFRNRLGDQSQIEKSASYRNSRLRWDLRWLDWARSVGLLTYEEHIDARGRAIHANTYYEKEGR